jgi:hypothetical protein
MISTAAKAVAVVGVAGAIVAAGTSVAGAKATGDQGPVRYSVSKHAVVHGAGHFRPGLVKIRVTGAKGHSLQIVKPRHGAGRYKLAADVNAFGQTGKANQLEHDFRLVGGASTGHSVFLTLRPGRYLFADSTPDSLTAKQIEVVHVSGRTSRASGYHSSGTIRAIHEMSWAKRPKSIPASGYLRFVNESTDSHFIVLARLKPGKTLSDVKKALMGQENESDVLYSGARSNFDNGVISSHRSETVSYDLHPGRYVMACFWPDENGMPHAMMGMIRTIKLT